MSARPWFKFYPSDWLSDPKLRTCPLEARSLWMDMICVMHEADPYGHLVINGQPVEPRELASLAGIPLKLCNQLVAKLASSGVLSRNENGAIFSRRMVRDYEKALKKQELGKLGGNPQLKREVNHDDNHAVKPRYQIPDTRKKDEDAASRQGTADIVPFNEPPKAKLFRVGKTLLVSLGISEKQSGSIIGRWLKQKNDPDGILAALQYAADHGVIEPIGYVTRCLSKDSRIEKSSLADQARELANRARELEANAGIGRPLTSIGSV